MPSGCLLAGSKRIWDKQSRADAVEPKVRCFLLIDSVSSAKALNKRSDEATELALLVFDQPAEPMVWRVSLYKWAVLIRHHDTITDPPLDRWLGRSTPNGGDKRLEDHLIG